MKTKKIKYGLIFFALAFLSCEDLLEVTPRSSITGQTFWQSEGDFAPYMNGIYNNYRAHIATSFHVGEDRSEMWVAGYNARFSPYWAHYITPSNTIQWTTYYGTIGHINLLLEKIEPFEFSNPQAKERIKAEAHAMRAAMYFFMARIWNDVPLVLDPVLDENAPLYPRSPVSQIFEQINSDIQHALSLFPEDGYRNRYRWTKPAVYALLADVKMWEATVLGSGSAAFNAAITAINEVENSNVRLLDNYRNIFEESRNDEIIMSFYLDRAEYTSGKYNEALLRFDTSAAADNADTLPLALAGQQAYCLSPRALALIDTYYPDDKRVHVTRVPEIFGGVVQNWWPYKFIGTQYPDTRIADSDIILYRLSDMLLLKAEAYAALNQTDNALIYLNMVRERANVPEYTETDKVMLQKEILDERGRELFHEIKRWYDLHRAHAMGVIDVYEYIPNLVGLTTPLFWPVHVNMMANNEQLVQTPGY